MKKQLVPAAGLLGIMMFLANACTPTEALSPFGGKVRHWGRAKPLAGASLQHLVASRAKANRLWRHFERQETDSACSLAAATIIINAMELGGHAPLTQDQVARLDSSGLWRQATQQGGPGLDLDVFGMHLMQAFFMLGRRHLAVDTVHASAVSQGEDEASLLVALRALEEQEDAYVIVNALQKALFDEGDDVGHYVVVAAYDEKRARVLLLDPDRRDMDPFWLSIADLRAAMRTPSELPGVMRGFILIREASH